MKNLLLKFRKQLPAIIGVALIVVNALVQANTIHLSNGVVSLINAILAAFGIGIIHQRQSSGSN